MLKIQEFLSCFESISEANTYLKSRLGISASEETIEGGDQSSYAVSLYRPTEHADLSNPLVRECNTLILDDCGRLVAKSWDIPKVCEDPKEIPIKQGSVVEELLDGPLIVIYNLEGRWHIATTGSVTGDEYIPGMRMPGFTYNLEVRRFLERTNRYWHSPFENLDPNLCFSFLYLNKYAKAIQPSMVDRLYLLAVYNMENETELNVNALDDLARRLGVSRPLTKDLHSAVGLSNSWNSLRALSQGLMIRSEGERFFLPNPIHYAVKNALAAGKIISVTHIAKIYKACRDEADLRTVGNVYPGWQDLLSVLHTTRNTLWKEVIELWNTGRKIEEPRKFAELVGAHPLNFLLFSRREGRIKSFSKEIDGLAPQRLVALARARFEKELTEAQRLINFEGGL